MLEPNGRPAYGCRHPRRSCRVPSVKIAFPVVRATSSRDRSSSYRAGPGTRARRPIRFEASRSASPITPPLSRKIFLICRLLPRLRWSAEGGINDRVPNGRILGGSAGFGLVVGEIHGFSYSSSKYAKTHRWLPAGLGVGTLVVVGGIHTGTDQRNSHIPPAVQKASPSEP